MTSGLTAATLRAGMGGPLSLARYEQLLPSFTRFLLAADCTTPRRSSMAIAQTGHESVGLRYAREIWGPNAQQRKYGQIGGSLAKQLGNIKPEDGYDYRGGGWLQVTGRANVGAVSRWAYARGYVPTPTFFLDHPDMLGDDRYVWIGPAWYWSAARPKLNSYADAGDIVAATKAINGGTYGLDDRRRRFEACLRLGDRLLPAATPARSVEDDMTPEQDKMLREVHKQLFGPWDSWADSKRKQTLVDFTRQVEAAETRALDYRGHHGAPNDNQFGQVLSLRKEVGAMRDEFVGLERKLDSILTTLAKQQ